MDIPLTNERDLAAAKLRRSLAEADAAIGTPSIESVTSLSRALGGSRRDAWGESVPDPIAEQMLRSPHLETIQRWLLERSVNVMGPLSGGAGSVVLDAGTYVVRMGHGVFTAPPPIAEMNQPLCGTTIGSVRVEVYPKAETASISEADVVEMSRVVLLRGYVFSDPGTDNLGRVNGKLVVIDPGALTPAKS